MIGVYDITSDEFRAATQADVDLYRQALAVSGKMVQVLRRLAPELVPPPGPDFIPRLAVSLQTWLERAVE